MSQILIQQYLNQLQDLRKVSGTHRESVVREAFNDLLKGWARAHDLVFVPEYEIETKTRDRRYVDGALLYELRMPFGYWEAKDEKDDLDAEIEYKFRRGYPQDNIIFEDSTEAVLIQHVLTEEIFSKVFGKDDFHHHNNVAKELYALKETFFTGDLKSAPRAASAPTTPRSSANCRVQLHRRQQCSRCGRWLHSVELRQPAIKRRWRVRGVAAQGIRSTLDSRRSRTNAL